MMTGEIEICGMKMFTTDHTKLIVQEIQNGMTYFSSAPITSKDMDLFLYVNAKFTHLEKQNRREMLLTLNTTMMKELCEVKRHSLRTLLTCYRSYRIFLHVYGKTRIYSIIDGRGR